MNRSVVIAVALWIPIPVALYGLTPKQKLMIRTALEAVDTAMAQNKQAEDHGKIVQEGADRALESANMAKVEAYMAKRSALATEQKALKAEKQAADLKAQNDRMLPVYNQVNKGCGFGAFAFGFTKLFHCLLWFIAAVAILAIGLVVASFFFPAILPAVIKFFRGVGGFFVKLPGRTTTLLQSIRQKVKRKPKPKDN